MKDVKKHEAGTVYQNNRGEYFAYLGLGTVTGIEEKRHIYAIINPYGAKRSRDSTAILPSDLIFLKSFKKNLGTETTTFITQTHTDFYRNKYDTKPFVVLDVW